MAQNFSSIAPATASLMVAEMQHRQANEMAATLATLRIMKSRGTIDDALLEQALVRVEAQAGIQRLLLDKPSNGTIVEAFNSLCTLLLRSRMGAEKVKIVLRATNTPVPTAMRIPLLQCAYELVNNAIKHSPTFDDEIVVTLERKGFAMVIAVSNKTFLSVAKLPKSMGMEIVQSMSNAWNGSMSVSEKSGRFCVEASFISMASSHLFRPINFKDTDGGGPVI